MEVKLRGRQISAKHLSFEYKWTISAFYCYSSCVLDLKLLSFKAVCQHWLGEISAETERQACEAPQAKCFIVNPMNHMENIIV